MVQTFFLNQHDYKECICKNLAHVIDSNLYLSFMHM